MIRPVNEISCAVNVQNVDQSHTLTARRDALLPKLISGDIQPMGREVFLNL
jgi:hypothetical protein